MLDASGSQSTMAKDLQTKQPGRTLSTNGNSARTLMHTVLYKYVRLALPFQAAVATNGRRPAPASSNRRVPPGGLSRARLEPQANKETYQHWSCSTGSCGTSNSTPVLERVPTTTRATTRRIPYNSRTRTGTWTCPFSLRTTSARRRGNRTRIPNQGPKTAGPAKQPPPVTESPLSHQGCRSRSFCLFR